MKKKKVGKEHKLLVFSCLIFFTTLLLQGATLPFVGVNSWNFNTYSQIAKNYLVFGYLYTFLAPVTSVAALMPISPEYYLHHPQLLSLVQSLFFMQLGESFFIARIPVIAASIISFFSIYKIAYMLSGQKYATACLVIGMLIPGFSIFGRMIGQEAFVLMFVILTVYSFLKYIQSGSRLWFFSSVISVLLGTLSDWPMVYFVFFFSIFAFFGKGKRLYLYLLATTTLAAVVFLAYIYAINSGFSDLTNAFLVRSPGEVTRLSSWYLSWFGTIFIRLLIYINPVIILLSIFGFFESYKDRKNSNRIFYLFLSLLFFGLFHVILYPEGSFGHAYWIYYIIPFFIFTSGVFLTRFSKNKIATLLLVFFSFIYLLGVVHWKTGETRGNVFRYILAKAASQYTTPYEQIDVNQESAVDPDLYEYVFDLDVSRTDAFDRQKTSVFTCSTDCGSVDALIAEEGENAVLIKMPDAKGIIVSPEIKRLENLHLIYSKKKDDESLARKIYPILMKYLKFPQL